MVAPEMALTPEQIQDGTEAIEKDRRKYVKKLRDAMKTEEAYRMDSAVSEVLEGLREGFRVHGLGSYIRYFCKETVSERSDCMRKQSPSSLSISTLA